MITYVPNLTILTCEPLLMIWQTKFEFENKIKYPSKVPHVYIWGLWQVRISTLHWGGGVCGPESVRYKTQCEPGITNREPCTIEHWYYK